ncbi:unnamed protein product [Timema podura]|uniref:Phosphoglycerate kinase n=1 Tax=Timema podura TaxID=61482 RepID=A0ABN7P4V6_TIMPD|nr:unnamed protein product [Timema podura]
MPLRKLSVKDLNITHRRVLLRVDLNMPIEDSLLTNSQQMYHALGTIKYILDQKPRYVILISQLGQPNGKKDINFTIKPIAKELQRILERKQVIFLNDCTGPEVEDKCRQSPQGSLILLENLYFFPEENTGNNLNGSNTILTKAGTITLQYALRRIADVFINDSFSTSYLLDSSMLCNAFEVRAAGLVLKKELEYFQRALHDPQRPYLVIFGGAKLMEKMKIIENMLPIVDEMIIGGSLAFTFLKVLKGMKIGDSVYCEKTAPYLKDFIQRAIALKVTIHLPVDFYITKIPVTDNSEAKLVHVADGIPKEWLGADIGDTSLKLFKDAICRANFIVWNGPMGLYEYSLFTKGSQGILDTVGEMTKNNHAITILSGEDTAACASLWGGESKVSHVSTGGLASVKILAGEALPGVVTLRRPFSHLKANLFLYD